jgi:hypothetical protein
LTEQADHSQHQAKQMMIQKSFQSDAITIRLSPSNECPDARPFS